MYAPYTALLFSIIGPFLLCKSIFFFAKHGIPYSILSLLKQVIGDAIKYIYLILVKIKKFFFDYNNIYSKSRNYI